MGYLRVRRQWLRMGYLHVRRHSSEWDTCTYGDTAQNGIPARTERVTQNRIPARTETVAQNVIPARMETQLRMGYLHVRRHSSEWDTCTYGD